MALLSRLVPDTEARTQEELVWLRLMVDSPRGVPDALVPHARERDDETRATLERVLSHLEVPDPDRSDVAAALRAVVDGLTLAVCTGRLSTADVPAQLRVHLAGRRG